MIKKFSENELKNYRSIPFWSWNDKLEKEKLIKQIDWMHENGIGGFFMHARSGLVTEYLSEEWMQCIEACAEHAEKLGMDAWAYDENGWPSGFVGGKLLNEDENHDRYLTYSVGAYDENALVSYIDNGDRLIRTNGGEDGIYVNVYEHLSTSTADILNPEVVDKFIKETHEAYKARYGEKIADKIKGFFTDEPQYHRWDTPYTVMIKKYFSEVYGEDILDNLGLLFLEKEGYREFRYKYWSGMQQLMLSGFAKKVYDWCDENGVKLTGHYVEESSLAGQMICCAGIMPFYEYEHIPGIDWLSRNCVNALSGRQITSVAAQLGKKQVLCEMYAGCGWDVTPRELKDLTEYLYINGVNTTCQHLLPYSERATRIHDYPAHYSEINPWVKHNFKEFNDYFTNLGALLGNSSEDVKVAVLHPIRTAYFDFKHEDGELFGNFIGGYGIIDMDVEFRAFIDKLEEKGIVYHFLDETLLAKYGSVEENRLICGKCAYDYIIIPSCLNTMDESTEKLLRAYVQAGGKVLLDGNKPEYLTWKPYSYDYLESNTSYSEIELSRGFKYEANGGKLCVSPRNTENGRFLYLLNHSLSESCEVSFDFDGEYNAFEKHYVDSDKVDKLPLNFTLRAGESALLVPVKADVTSEEDYEIIIPQNNFKVVSSELNSLNIDNLSYSFDGVNYSESKYVFIAFSELLKQRYTGDLYLKYCFEVKAVPSVIEFDVSLPRVKEVYINGTSLQYYSSNFSSGNVSEYIKTGANEIIIKLDYFQNDNVYYVLFGENVTESLKNCLVYDSEIEPLVIKGDFGVYSKNGFSQGKSKNVRIGNDFYLDKPKTEITTLVDNGYTFFAGKITLSQQIELSGKPAKLKLSGRWHAATVMLNGKLVGTLLTENMIDISDYVKSGQNELEIEYVIGNRNLYGPHHHIEEELDMTTPAMFEFNDNDGVSVYQESSAFVEAFTEE